MRRHISLMAKHIRTYNCTLISKLKELNDFLAHKPQGLVFWQGRRWSEATTLPRCAARGNPLGLVIQNHPHIAV